MSNTLNIKIKEGNLAPRYPVEVKQLTANTAVITENGMANGLPVVDIQMTDEEGNEYFFMLTGKLFNGLSAVIKGVNLKNHGVEEPE